MKIGHILANDLSYATVIEDSAAWTIFDNMLKQLTPTKISQPIP
jgi:hypothetical protein